MRKTYTVRETKSGKIHTLFTRAMTALVIFELWTSDLKYTVKEGM